MINADPNLEIDDVLKKKAVTMSADWTTQTDGIGERTYLKGHTYRVDEGALKEMTAQPEFLGELVFIYPWELSRPVFSMVKVNSFVSRFFTSDGTDAYHLEKNKASEVPSNLAVFLVASGYAESGHA